MIALVSLPDENGYPRRDVRLGWAYLALYVWGITGTIATGLSVFRQKAA